MTKPHLVIAVVGLAALLVVLACGVVLYQRSLLASGYEHRVCLVQGTRVTFVNGVWQGLGQLNPGDPQTSLDSCPMKWEYLTAAGAEVWELVAVVPLTPPTDERALEFYLRREAR